MLYFDKCSFGCCVFFRGDKKKDMYRVKGK